MDFYREVVIELTTETVNIRALPTINSADIGNIRNGDTIGYRMPVIGVEWSGEKYWLPVKKGNVEGYVNKKLVVMPDDWNETELPKDTVIAMLQDVIDYLKGL